MLQVTHAATQMLDYLNSFECIITVIMISHDISHAVCPICAENMLGPDSCCVPSAGILQATS